MRVLIRLEIDALGENMDVFLPDFMLIREANTLIRHSLRELAGHPVALADRQALYMGTKRLPEEACVRDCGIINCSRLSFR